MSILVDLAKIYSRTIKTRIAIYLSYRSGGKIYSLKNLIYLANLEIEAINFCLNDLARIFYFYTNLNKYLYLKY